MVSKTKVAVILSSIMILSGGTSYAGCDTSSLSGSYAFRVAGENLGLLDSSNAIHAFQRPEQFAGVGEYTFDGNGGFTRIDWNTGLGTPAFPPSPVNDEGFRTGVTGTYTVSEDCTGTITVGLATVGTQIILAIALVNYGEGFYGVIKSEHAATFSAANNTSDLSCASGCEVAVDLRVEAQKNSARRR
jgi:hypothetical protein